MPDRAHKTVSQSASVQAKLLKNGQASLTLSFSELAFANWATWTTMGALNQDERRWRELAGVTYLQARALTDEITAVLRFIEGRPQTVDPQTGEVWPPSEPTRTSTAWDELPRLEIAQVVDPLEDTKLPNRRVVLVLASEKVAALAGAFETSLVRVAPNRSGAEEESFRIRFASSTKEAEAFRDELRQLERELRLKSSS
jgi:hypothetical protein